MGTEDLWRWAEEHHGLLLVDEVATAELSRRAAQDVRASGEFEYLSPRVLRRRGSPRTPHQTVLAAALDAGCGIAVAGDAGGWLWRAPGFALAEPVELTRQRGTSHPSRDLLGRVVERRYLPPEHVTAVDGIPVLTLPVLLYQFAATLSPARFERVADTIVGRSPAVLAALHDLMPELGKRGRNGISVMRQYLELRPAAMRMPTGLERKFESLVDGAGLRPFTRQVDLGGHSWIGRTDYYDHELKLVVEIQSSTYHSSLLDRAADQKRVDALLAAGFRGVLQIDEDVLWYRPHLVGPAVRRARAMLSGRSVTWSDATGVRLQVTEPGLGGRWGGGGGGDGGGDGGGGRGAGRMSA